MKMFSSSLLLGLAGMVLAQDPDTTDPAVTAVDGDLVVSVGSGQDVVFTMGDDSISISELPVGLRGYTDATIGALGAGFNMGRAQGDAQGRNYANEAELRLNAAMSSQASVINAMGSTIGVLASDLSTAQRSPRRSRRSPTSRAIWRPRRPRRSRWVPRHAPRRLRRPRPWPTCSAQPTGP